MRILAFSNCPLDPLLGSGQTRLAWSNGLKHRGHSVKVLDSNDLLPLCHLPLGRRLKLGYSAARILAAARLSQYDLIEFYGAEFWLPTWLINQRNVKKRPLTVAHTDGLELACDERMRTAGLAEHPKNPIKRILYSANKLAFSASDCFVTASAADRDYALASALYSPEKVAVVRLGLRPPFLEAPAETPDSNSRENRISFLGSWIKRKGINPLIKVLQQLLKNRPIIRASILGTGVSDAVIRAEFDPTIQKRIEIREKASVQHVKEVLSKSKVFLFPTEYEGFGLGLAEAMACGCAAITTATGFGAELEHGTEALICPFGDHQSMLEASEWLFDHETDRIGIARQGQVKARALNWGTSVDKLEKTYLDWIAAKR